MGLEQQVNGIVQLQFSPDDKTLAVSTNAAESMMITLYHTARDAPPRVAEVAPPAASR